MPTCPYCVEDVTEDDLSYDHIFVEALGGRARIPAHRSCNSRFGHEVEGRLTRPGEQLNLRVLRGSVKNDPTDSVEIDLNTGSLRWRKPVLTHDDGGNRYYAVRGEREDVLRRLKGQMGAKLGLETEMVDNLVLNATASTEPLEVISELTFDIQLARRLLAKVALGALVRSHPDTVTSLLAQHLRGIMWGREVSDAGISLRALDVVVDAAAQLGVDIEPLVPVRPATDRPGHPRAEGRIASRAIFIPRGPETAVYAFLGTQPLAFSGVVVTGACPLGDGLPVVALDAPGGMSVRSIGDEIARALAKSAPQSIGTDPAASH